MSELAKSSLIWRFYRFSKNTSAAYRGTMLVIFCVYFVATWSIMQSLIEIPSDQYNGLILRSFFEASLLVSICHYLVRPYLRMNMIGIHLNTEILAFGMLYLMCISFVYFLISYGFGKLSIMESTDISQITITNQDGTLDGEVKLFAIGVIGTLQSFATLCFWGIVYLVWHAQKNKTELQSQVNESQIQQLTNQLSPHFLFNTLNSIRALIFSDKEKAAEVITLLSDLLRNQMQSQMDVRSSLEKEWLTTSKYLAIEKVRFDNRLSVEVDLDESTLQQQIPTLTILTLAENAVKHGITPSKKLGVISIGSCRLDNDMWRLTVKNSVHNKIVQPGTRVGLRNIKKRLEFMFGSKFTCSSNHLDNEFIFTMELPYAKSINR